MESAALFPCDICKQCFSLKSNLDTHFKKTHSASEKIFTCNKCFYKTNRQFVLNRHINKKHGNVSFRKIPVYCPLCKCSKNTKDDMKYHYFEEHKIKIEIQENVLSSENDFIKWKEDIERTSGCEFVKDQTNYVSKKDGSKKVHLVCHRDGVFKSKGNNKRQLKLLGTNKINGYCPANIIATIQNSGQVNINYCLTHVGHQSDMGRLRLTTTEKLKIAEQMALKIPFDVILDNIRSSVCGSDLQRLHLLSRKDLFNIQNQFSLKSQAVRHSNDCVSVESWIAEMQSSGDVVRFYKSQGDILQTYCDLKKEDFIVIIMNDAQLDMLRQFGENIVCLDSTHGLNNYGFQLSTLMVLDDMMQGFPCAFMFSNRVDRTIIEIFFKVIRDAIGKVMDTNVFMSDMADEFYNAWQKIMSSTKYQLYCTWHVDRAWRKNLFKISSNEKQIEIYKILRTLLEETDKEAFHRMLIASISLMKSDCDSRTFGEYFDKVYAASASKWAYCYRLHAGINTNMHLERMHGVLKHVYMHGNKPKRLDISIHVLMRFIRDKLFDRLINLNKGKISSKLNLLRQRHKLALDISSESIVSSEKPWTVLSKNQKNLYEIKETDKLNCLCNLRCHECNVCIHAYICSCTDSSIKFNMCKHIHLCIIKLCNEESATTRTSYVDNSYLYIAENPNQIENQSLLKELRNPFLTPNTVSVNNIKENIMKQVKEILNEAKTEEDLATVSRFIQPILPTLRSDKRKHEMVEASLPSTSKTMKFDHQRRLLSTKKPRTKNKKSIVKPTIEETELISANLLLTNDRLN